MRMLGDVAQLSKCFIGLCPAAELSFHSLQHTSQCGEVTIMEAKPSGQLPDPLDGCQLRTVRWKKQKLQVCSVLVQERGQDYSVMVASVVQHENDTATLRSMPQQLREEALKGYGIEQPCRWCGRTDRCAG